MGNFDQRASAAFGRNQAKRQPYKPLVDIVFGLLSANQPSLATDISDSRSPDKLPHLNATCNDADVFMGSDDLPLIASVGQD
jgi:hypothetical protein